MNIKFLIKFINLILLLILIKSLKKCYFVYITLSFKCVYLYNKLFTVLKFLFFFFINKILYSLLNIYINFQLFTGKFFNLLKFCFGIYQQNILKIFLILNLYRLINIKLLKLLKKFKFQFAMAIDFCDIRNYILLVYIIKINFITILCIV